MALIMRLGSTRHSLADRAAIEALGLDYLKAEPKFDWLGSDPRIQELLRGVGLLI